MRLQWASAVILTSALVLGGCADTGAETSPDPDPTGAATTEATPGATGSATAGAATQTPTEEAPESVTVEITVDGGSVSPRGERVDVALGEPVIFSITADAAGEFHVHSTPEQHLEFGAGTTTRELTFDTPGIVEVESHDPHQVVVQLQVQ